MRVSAYFFGSPGDSMDKAVRHIFETYKGRSMGAGTMLAGKSAGERDVQYDVPEGLAEDCRTALQKAGYRLEPTSA